MGACAKVTNGITIDKQRMAIFFILHLYQNIQKVTFQKLTVILVLSNKNTITFIINFLNQVNNLN